MMVFLSRKIIHFQPLGTSDPRTDMEQSKTLLRECNELVVANPNARGGNFGLENALEVHEESKNEPKIDASTSSTLEKLEYTGENNFHLKDRSSTLEASPTNRKTLLCRRKGKEKVFSGGDVRESMSKYEDDTNESAESCNSIQLFSTGMKRWGVQQELIGGSKRVRKQIQESPASTAITRKDSSFMNWISNMMNGLNKSDQDEGPTLAHPHTSFEQKTITYNRYHDTRCRNMGFQSVFQSLYSHSPKEQETKVSNGDYPVGGSKELVLADKTCGENDKFKEISYEHEVDPSVKPTIVSMDKELQIHENVDQKSLFKLKPILAHKSSEEMDSVFARRLDALKHIKSSDMIEIERMNIVRYVNSFDGVGESPCLNSKWNGPISSNKGIIASSDNMLVGKQISYSDNFVSKKSTNVPRGMFDAIKKLRLTRTDILKWMKSSTSPSHLDGFVLRLRLGKREGGIWGTSYHVACITGEQRELLSSQGRKNPIYASIGDTRFSVESKYISNQDFLEDELVAWWCSILKTGGKIPSEDYLKMKLEERKLLGF